MSGQMRSIRNIIRFWSEQSGVVSQSQLIAINILMMLLGILSIIIILTRDDPNTDYEALAMDDAEIWEYAFHHIPRGAIAYDWGYMSLSPKYGSWISANGEILKFANYTWKDGATKRGLMLEATPTENGILREIDEVKTGRTYTIVFDAALPNHATLSDGDAIGVFIDGRLRGTAFQSTTPMTHRIEFKFKRGLSVPILEIKSLSAADGHSAVINNIRLLNGAFGPKPDDEAADE